MNVTSFLEYLKFEKRFSPHTIEAYRCDLEQLSDFLKERRVIEPQAISAGHLRSWMVHLLQGGCAARSVHRKISAVRSWFRYLLKRGVVKSNPATRLILPKTARRLPVMTEESALHHLFQSVVWSEGFQGMRDRMVMELLYQTGLRRSELIGLKMADIDLVRRSLKVKGKGDKSRVIPFGEGLERQLSKYVQMRSDAFSGVLTEALLLGDRGKALTEKQVYLIVRRYLSVVTNQEKRSPHVMRHAFATHLSNHGAELTAIKELLGHSSLAATQVYMHNSVERLRQVYLQAHPKSGKVDS
jgi:integrase/recombinase XerC